MDLSHPILVDFIDRTKIRSDHPLLTVQRVVRYVGENVCEDFDIADLEEYKTRVVSLTKKHWKMFEVLTDQVSISAYTLFQAADQHTSVSPDCMTKHLDEKLEKSIELIWAMLGLNEEGAIERLSEIEADIDEVNSGLDSRLDGGFDDVSESPYEGVISKTRH